MSQSFTLPSLPATLVWKNPPLTHAVDSPQQFSITAGSKTDWFVDPAGENTIGNAPVALFAPPDKAFCLQARVAVEFASQYDAGVLFVDGDEDRWAKLCFEFSPQHQPMIVSVVTRGVSDDCNSAAITEHAVYLRLYRRDGVFAFHYSLDGRYWQLVRYFSLGQLAQLRVGFSAQSPTGAGCKAIFSEISYTSGALSDLRNGE